MDILGIIVILTLPYMAGYILKNILNMKETSQIETYLTGFFFVFLVQGLVFAVGFNGLHAGFSSICSAFTVAIICIAVLFAVIFTVNLIKLFKRGRHDDVYHAKWHRLDIAMMMLANLVILLIIIRVILLKDYIRTDLMLPTVRTTLSTNTIYEYNPITSRPFTMGLIGSKKIIALPIYYAYLCKAFGINETILLFIVLSLQTIMCTYFACLSFIIPILRNRRSSIMFGFFLGILILSGDYFSGALGAKLLWNGYQGETIVGAVMLPYILYVVTAWYRQERGDYPYEVDKALRIKNIIKIVICALASLFITGLTSGLLLILIEVMVIGLCSVARFMAEGRLHIDKKEGES